MSTNSLMLSLPGNGTHRTIGALKRLFNSVSCLQSTSHQPLKTGLDYLPLEEILKRFFATTLSSTESFLACDCDRVFPRCQHHEVSPHTLYPETCYSTRGLLLEYRWQISEQSLFIQQIINLLFFFYCFIYLFGCPGSQLWLTGSLVAAHWLLSCSRRAPQLRHACGIQFPDQGSNPGPLHWEHGVLSTVPPGKSLIYFLIASEL